MATTKFRYRPSVLSVVALIFLIYGIWLFIMLETHDGHDEGYGYLAALSLGILFVISAFVDLILQIIIRKRKLLNIIEGALVLIAWLLFYLWSEQII